MTMNFDKCKERYQNDAEFHSVVEMFYRLIFEHKMSLAELKDALMFAGLKFEMENVRENLILREDQSK